MKQNIKKQLHNLHLQEKTLIMSIHHKAQWAERQL